ncbi:MAG: hypothetical protein AAF203_06850, partial [Pseudomonadota bacterium]
TLTQFAIVMFYVAAGSLKLNIDWLSGAAMISTPLLSGRLLVASLYYVVFLELIFAFGLLSTHPMIRRFCLLQFILFHLFSWHIVGFFYPMVMFSLLWIYIDDEIKILQAKREAPRLGMDFLSGKLPRSIYLFIVFFVALQAFPFVFFKDPSLSGAARLSSLNMFDSKTNCKSILVAQIDNKSIHLEEPVKNLGVRLRCDPLVFLNQAHQICRRNRKSKQFDRLSLGLFSKRITKLNYSKVLKIDDVCQLNFPLWAEFMRDRS